MITRILKKTKKASNIQVETVSQTFQNTVQSNAQLMRHKVTVRR